MLSGDDSSFHLSNRGLRYMKQQPSEGIEGLRILIHHKEQGANVVVKAKMMMMMMPTTTTCNLNSQAYHLPKGLPWLALLKKCCLCRRELSPANDVYMYRGDKGFCSEECRSRQILLDERREFEVATRERSKLPRAGNEIGESDRSRRIPTLV
ncbi:unnamed protein product [Musa acuminata subsp. malaccensis]|uniref:(wild Malaysian banana) hypothetical protein n=1 Tax=Musa acuminata subsp. malaccensis TaxID=214687 RepID=A0A804JQ04_MUSAM|nr:PREDICTED: uncharacterized protein LOC103989991 isoform X1 [Musa acuminata subsp. malaccensis]CAG1848618.1 unnamed protein product [Musa acuminata subsp. malaccensis]